ncbi:hypothetical protein ACTXKH_02340 [Brachybacterium tyrofermentans]|uniref:hypothetical protein n=1 Tax=Brachybacterium tyrofermentans TaxID=47848 RepID=UPI003F8E18CC
MAYQASYGMYQEPRKKRGLKRIIFGILGIIANGIGLLVMPLVAGAIVAAFAVMSSTPVSTGGSPAILDASVTSLYYVSVPTSEAVSVSCSVDGSSDVEWEPDVSSVTTTVDGVEYTEVGSLQVLDDQEVTITCDGASDIAVSDIGLIGTLIGVGVGLVIPIGLGILAFGLLIWGIIARVRS